jgi:hypothetical protein
VNISKEYKVRKRKKNRAHPWFKKLLVGAFMWLAKKVFEPIPVLCAFAEIVAFAV